MLSFNPHTHEGCDCVVTFWLPTRLVSIHTPTKGVTWCCSLSVASCSCFNPHTHEGCDAMSSESFAFLTSVSIHTPTKGVTRFLVPCVWRQHVSIHTPTKGVTLISIKSIRLVLFQSTHPRRVWPLLIARLAKVWRFNPHTHEGCDFAASNYIYPL